MQLSRPTILDAALEILNSYGLADTTMRRIAKQLGVAPGALYWHFPHKQALLSGIARQLLAPVLGEEPSCTSLHARTPAPDLPQDTALERTVATCAHVRLCMLAVTDGADVVATALADDEVRQRLVDRVAGDVAHLCGPATAPEAVAAALIDFVVGATVGEQSRSRLAQFSPAAGAQDNSPTAAHSPQQESETETEPEPVAQAQASTAMAMPGAQALQWGLRMFLAGVAAQPGAPASTR